ncbi:MULTISPECIES: large conductance mechanosensitive channel protein MscL [Lachnospira]|uniref:Large-conductance mechanosensitive channel n=1 Tax=Lachnospira multipara TaxID=28051 RepID=A0A1H5S7P2_9FIRM|nr:MULTISPECIES: large conductance mechanosensitive channel protein MscL [Lachnospira]MBQ2473677.1 large conductance mechanosensitive channel protein MscL [Lachnospira sp.]SEF46629.1 large conductance mechanosensitive channel [Lachnospira multipara]
MKKFFKEFKEFALKGNVMDMAVGVIIGAAFGSIVTALTTDFINPLINSIGGASFGGKIHLPWSGTGENAQYLLWGDFLTQVVNFIIMAFCIFVMVKAINKLTSLGKKEEVKDPTEKECPYCFSKISIKATRCPHCTSELK